MNDRDAILAQLPEGTGGELVPPLEMSTSGPLWERFEAVLLGLGGRIATLDEARERSAANRCYCDPDVLTHISPPSKADIWDAEVGLTMADLAIADTGSIVIANAPGRARLASLAPPLHIALVPQAAIVGTLAETFTRISERTTVIISGTSRTADIEGVLVRGVHGPRELWVVPV